MRLRKELRLRKVGKDYIIVEPGQDKVDMVKVFTLNESAAWLWEQVEGDNFSRDDLTKLLLEKYDVAPEKASEDVESLIAVFLTQNFLEERE